MIPCHLLMDYTSIITFLIFIITFYIWRNRSNKGHLWYAPNKINQSIIDSCSTLSKGQYTPTFYLRHPLLQTIVPSFFSSKAEYLTFKIEQVPMSKGGYSIIAWPENAKVTKTNPKRNNILAVVLPGVSGHAGDNYVRDMIDALSKEGYECVVYLPRFNCEEIMLPTEGYNDVPLDFKEGLDYIMEKKKGMKIIGVGHSYGANLLVNYLGRFNDDDRCIGGVSISNPLNFMFSEVYIRQSWAGKIIAKLFEKNIHRSKHTLAAAKHYKMDMERLLASTTVREFHTHYSCKVYGFDTVDQYCWDLSSISRITNVRKPLLILNSDDDPVIHPGSITKYDVEELCPTVILRTTAKGGHLGWVQGIFRLSRWNIKPTIEFVNAVVDLEA